MVLQPEPRVSKKLSPFFLVNKPTINTNINITISVVINVNGFSISIILYVCNADEKELDN